MKAETETGLPVIRPNRSVWVLPNGQVVDVEFEGRNDDDSAFSHGIFVKKWLAFRLDRFFPDRQEVEIALRIRKRAKALLAEHPDLVLDSDEDGFSNPYSGDLAYNQAAEEEGCIRIKPLTSAPAPKRTAVMLRPLQLPDGLSGGIWLTSMPGRFEPLAEFLNKCEENAIEEIICLVRDEEIEEKSPDYAAVLRSGHWPLAIRRFAVPDYDVPDDVDGLLACASEVVAKLRRGRKIVIHCAAGHGRTGLFAVTVLLAAGRSLAAARCDVKRAGSNPETDSQNALLEEIATSLRKTLPPLRRGLQQIRA